MKMALFGFVLMIAVLGALLVVTGGVDLAGVGIPSSETSSPAAPAPAQGGNDPFGSLKIN